jgi:general secretion pathway protein J
MTDAAITRTGRRRDMAGFTLIELVIALALTGLVSLILLQGMRLAVGGLDRVSRHADRLDQRRGVDTILRHALTASLSGPVIDGAAGFLGEPTRLKFLTIAEDGGVGLYRIDLALAGARLVMMRQLADPSVERRLEQSVLAADVRFFRLAYFGATAPGEDPGWHERWEGLSFLPKLVRVTLEAGDGIARPPLVVRLWNGG